MLLEYIGYTLWRMHTHQTVLQHPFRWGALLPILSGLHELSSGRMTRQCIADRVDFA